MRNRWMKTPALMAMIGVGIQVFVPLFFGMFKQQATADVHTLEAHFHGMRNSEGSVVERVRYNKGI